MTNVIEFNQTDKAIFKDGFIEKCAHISGSKIKLTASSTSEIEELDSIVDELKKHTAFLTAWKQSAQLFPDFFLWKKSGVNCKYDLLPNFEKKGNLQLLEKSDAFFVCAVWRFCYPDRVNKLLYEQGVTEKREDEFFSMLSLEMKNLYRLLVDNASPWTS